MNQKRYAVCRMPTDQPTNQAKIPSWMDVSLMTFLQWCRLIIISARSTFARALLSVAPLGVAILLTLLAATPPSASNISSSTPINVSVILEEFLKLIDLGRATLCQCYSHSIVLRFTNSSLESCLVWGLRLQPTFCLGIWKMWMGIRIGNLCLCRHWIVLVYLAVCGRASLSKSERAEAGCSRLIPCQS